MRRARFILVGVIMETITVEKYYSLLSAGIEPILLDGVTKSCGGLYDKHGKPLSYNDKIKVKIDD